jgi:hypothetical protein
MKHLAKTVLLILGLIVFVLTIRSFAKITTTTAPDFSVLYTSTRDFLSHTNPYIDKTLIYPHVLPPITSVFYIPFALMDYKVALPFFLAISILFAALCVYLSMKIGFKKFSPYIFLAALSLTFLSFPTKFTFGMGQVNSISLLFLLFSYYFYQKEKHLFSAVLLGISIISKPIFAFFVVFYLTKKSWKLLSYLAASLFLFFLISIFIEKSYLYFYWFNNVLPTLLTTFGRDVYYNQGIMGFVSRLSSDPNIRLYLTGIISAVFILVTVLFTLKRKNPNLQFSHFIVTLLLIDGLSWQHHFIWLIFPFIIQARYLIKFKKTLLWIIFALAYLLISWNFKDTHILSGFSWSLALSNTFYGALVLYFLGVYLLNRG